MPGQIHFIRLLCSGLDEKALSPSLAQASKTNIVQLVINAKDGEQIAVAQYYVLKNSTDLTMELLDNGKRYWDVAKAVVVEVSGRGAKSDIYQCRIRPVKETTLLLDLTAYPECSIKYPWTSLLKLKLSKKLEALLLNKNGARNLPGMPLGTPPILSWTLDKKAGKITFTIRTEAFADWRAEAKRLSAKRKQAKKEYAAAVKKAGYRGSERRKITSSYEDASKKLDKLLDKLVERITKFAGACEKFHGIEVLDPWGAPLERLNVKCPIPADKSQVGTFVEQLEES